MDEAEPFAILGECVCGCSVDLFNTDCERCGLIYTICCMTRELYDVWRKRIDEDMAAEKIATLFNLRIDDVRRIVGR